jgi:hypothetical protein
LMFNDLSSFYTLGSFFLLNYKSSQKNIIFAPKFKDLIQSSK